MRKAYRHRTLNSIGKFRTYYQEFHRIAGWLKAHKYINEETFNNISGTSNVLASVFPHISETSERLHVRVLLTSRLDLVLLANSSGRYHFWVLHTVMQHFGDTLYAVPKNLPITDLMQDHRMPASIPSRPEAQSGKCSPIDGWVIAVACSTEVLKSLGRVCDCLERASETLQR